VKVPLYRRGRATGALGYRAVRNLGSDGRKAVFESTGHELKKSNVFWEWPWNKLLDRQRVSRDRGKIRGGRKGFWGHSEPLTVKTRGNSKIGMALGNAAGVGTFEKREKKREERKRDL